MPESRYAIVIGNSHYTADARLEDLRCPERDVEGLASILEDARIGQFREVQRFISNSRSRPVSPIRPMSEASHGPFDDPFVAFDTTYTIGVDARLGIKQIDASTRA